MLHRPRCRIKARNGRADGRERAKRPSSRRARLVQEVEDRHCGKKYREKDERRRGRSSARLAAVILFIQAQVDETWRLKLTKVWHAGLEIPDG